MWFPPPYFLSHKGTHLSASEHRESQFWVSKWALGSGRDIAQGPVELKTLCWVHVHSPRGWGIGQRKLRLLQKGSGEGLRAMVAPLSIWAKKRA